MTLQNPGPSSSMVQLVSTGSPCLPRRCFGLPCTSTGRSRSGRSAAFCPSHTDFLCALSKDTRTWSSQTATTDWTLHQGKSAEGLGGLLAWCHHLDSFALKDKELKKWEDSWGDKSQLNLDILAACMDPAVEGRFNPISLAMRPFGLSGSLRQKPSNLSTASFIPSN